MAIRRLVLIGGLIAFVVTGWSKWGMGIPYVTASGVSFGALQIGLVHTGANDSDPLTTGAELAIAEINGKGGILGKYVAARSEQQMSPSGHSTAEIVGDAVRIANELSAEKGIVAVIGHSSSTAAIPASAVYEGKDKLYLAPYATNMALSAHHYSRVFELLPNDRRSAELMARYADEIGLKKMVILSDRSEYGQQTAIMFARYAEEQGIRIVVRDSFDSSRRSIEQILLTLLDNTSFSMSEVDGMLVIGQPVDSGRLIAAARHLGIKMPILGTDTMSRPECIAAAGPAMKDVVALTVYYPGKISAAGDAFAQAYRKRYNTEPDAWAALGYDAVNLVAEMAERRGSVASNDLADSLRVMRFVSPYVGVTGSFSFNSQGEAVSKPVFIIRHDGQSFQLVRTYEADAAETQSNDHIADKAVEKNVADGMH